MKPPCRTPSKQRQTRNDVRPESQYWLVATTLHKTICVGIQRSGPIHLETSWDGSSAQRNESLIMVFPRL